MDSDISVNETNAIDPSYEPTDLPLLIILSPTGSQSTGSEGGKKSRPKQKSYRKKVESVWSHESIIKLIEEVEIRRSLWDAGCAEYKLPKDIVWQEVADAIQVSLNDCKGKWANLRTSFNCNLKKYRRKKSGQGTEKSFQIVWRYFKPMMFLETTKVRQTTKSISSMKLESATTDESIIWDMGFTDELRSTTPCTSGQQRNRKSAPTTSSTPSRSGRKAGSKGGKKSRPKQKSYRKKVESVWAHESIIKLIEEVEVRRSLWDAGCAEYKLPKEIVWQEVADAIQVSLNDCKGKWANLRTSFNCNLEKYRRKKSGQGTEENFQIVWRYFKPMMFLETTKIRQATQSISSVKLESATTDESIICDMRFTDGLRSTAPCTSGQQRNRKSAPTTSSTPSSSGRKADLKEVAIDALQSLQCSDSQPKDTSTVFGEYIAAELRILSPELAAFARAKLRRAFNDILDEVALMVPQQQQ